MVKKIKLNTICINNFNNAILYIIDSDNDLHLRHVTNKEIF